MDPLAQTETEKHIFFWKKPSIYSQWHESKFCENDTVYNSAEQYMMAKKAQLFGDHEILHEILKVRNPGRIKSLGRKVKNFDETKWDENKEEIVYNANLLKFGQNSDLKSQLLSTKNKILIEASPHDYIWGIGKSVNDIPDPESFNINNCSGQNLLGKAIMKVRNSFLSEDQPI